MGVEPVQDLLRVFAEIVVALEAKIGPFDPEELLVFGGDVVVDRLHVGRRHGEVVVDLGDDEYTVGRPHPMIDPRLRTDMLREVLHDPSTAVVLLDVVLGHGASADTAGPLAATIAEAGGARDPDGGQVAVVASVCGTPADPQGLLAQESALTSVGVIVAASNAQAARTAARIIERHRVAPAAEPNGRA